MQSETSFLKSSLGENKNASCSSDDASVDGEHQNSAPSEPESNRTSTVPASKPSDELHTSSREPLLREEIALDDAAATSGLT